MSKETSWVNIIGGIVGGALAVGTIAAAGAAVMRESEKYEKERQSFREKVSARMQALDHVFASSNDATKELIKEEVTRLASVQNAYQTKHFDELNRLFDTIIEGVSVIDVVRATETRSQLIKDITVQPVKTTVATSSRNAREELYREIDRINQRLSEPQISFNEEYQLLSLRDQLYKKLY